MKNPRMLAAAVRLAAEAHEDQLDKGGFAYILHPLRVMAAVRLAGFYEAIQVVAVLHDVVEDTGWSLDALLHEGFSKGIVDAVDAISRRPDEDDYEEYLRRCCRDELAAVVKRYDALDNLDPIRLHQITDLKHRAQLFTKYQRALALTASVATPHRR